MALVVAKFGGSSVATPERIKNVAARLVRRHNAGNQVVAVVSAMGDNTDHLLDLAHSVNPDPPAREMDMLLSTGEQGVKDGTVKIGQTCFRNRLAIGSRRDQNVLQLIKFRWGQPDVLVVNTLVAPVRNAPARDKARLETHIELGNFNDENLTSLKRQTMQLIVRGIGEGGIIGASIPNARNESTPDSFEGNRRYWGETGLFLKTQNDSPPVGVGKGADAFPDIVAQLGGTLLYLDRIVVCPLLSKPGNNLLEFVGIHGKTPKPALA